MAQKYSVAVRNAILEAIEATIGSNAVLKLRTGAAPANADAADTGTVLATIPLGADWASAAALGSKSLAAAVQDPSADASGDAGHFRIYAADGVTCGMQGSVSNLEGSGDLK